MKRICFLIFLFWGIKGFSQVNLNSGSAVFKLPIFNWQDNKSRLNLNISADYNSGSGLQINSVSSLIGQGWNLIAGGVISRMQVGEPDDQKPNRSSASPEDTKKYPAGRLYQELPYPPGIPNARTSYPLYKDKNHIYKEHNVVAEDREVDYFSAQFNGRTAMFVLSNGSYGSPTAAFLGNTRMNIRFETDDNLIQQGIRTTISAFYIQDENGLIYKFSTLERSKVLRTQYCNKDLTNKITQPNFKTGKVYYEKGFEDPDIENPYIITSWYLTEISDPLTGRKVNFTYETRDIHANSGATVSYHEINKDATFPAPPPTYYALVSYSVSITKTPFLTSISCEDGHSVQFNYNPAVRFDLDNTKALSSIDINYQNRFVSKYQFNTSYFILKRCGTPASDAEKRASRLCLKSVQKLGPDLRASEMPYKFDYFLGSGTADDIIPPPFFHLKDIWGYYNGDYSKGANNASIPINTPLNGLNFTQLKGLCFLRNGSSSLSYSVKPGYARNGLLKQINFPTGSRLSYVYEQNQGVVPPGNQTIDVGGVHVSQTSLSDGLCNTPVLTNYVYTLEGSNLSSRWGFETPVNSISLTNYFSPKGWFWRWSFPIGHCGYRYTYPGIASKDQGFSLTASQQFWSTVLSIASSASTTFDIINLLFISSGPGAVFAVVVDALVGIANFINTCLVSPNKTDHINVYFNTDLNSANPLPTQFKRVEVSGGSGGNGKVIHEFTSDSDYPLWEPTNVTFSMKQRFAPWVYGLPKKTSIVDAAGSKIKETDYFYEKTTAFQIPFFCHSCNTAFYSYKALVKKSSSKIVTEWDDPAFYQSSNTTDYTTDLTSNPDMLVEGYNMYTGICLLTKTTEKMFGQANNFTQTEYTYNDDPYNFDANFQVNEIKTTQSNGDISYKYFKYNPDFGLYSNLYNLPITVSAAYQKAGSTDIYYTGEMVTEYTTLASGNIVPFRTREQRFASPQLSTSVVLYTGPDDQTPKYIQTEKTDYDSYGNAETLMDEGGHTVAQIYDYNDKFIVATVINANKILDKPAYTSFESSDLSRSGWSCNVALNPNSANAVTGKSCLSLQSGMALSAPLNSAKPYTLSFWASSAVAITGSHTLLKSQPAINGFTYYEYRVAQGTSAITISGSGNIDELRLYPQNARMKTVTYDPLLGRTSECDENNRITYYDYDELGRLQLVKDENKHIVKMFEYNVQNPPNNCGETYHNMTVSVIYTKNNCSAGYAGSEVAYTIPDSKYTSSVSQEAVDALVQAELNSSGQAYANSNGSCLQVYTNDVMSEPFTKEDCGVGYKGPSVTYTVPEGRYSSTISKQDANDQAQDEIDANGQAYANFPGTANCVVDYDAEWEAESTAPRQCESSGGVNTGHQLILCTDVNPNSATYNQQQWKDMGENTSACPVIPCPNCSAEGRKCINDHCEIGIKIYTDSRCISGHCQFTYHYEWSDGSWSQNYTENSVSGCTVGGLICAYPNNP